MRPEVKEGDPGLQDPAIAFGFDPEHHVEGRTSAQRCHAVSQSEAHGIQRATAIAEFEEALRILPTMPEALLNLGNLYGDVAAETGGDDAAAIAMHLGRADMSPMIRGDAAVGTRIFLR